jgi:hypothetical protein
VCGIAGWSFKEAPSRDFILSLMYHMEERGSQSFGIYDGDTNAIEKSIGRITEKQPAYKLQFKQGFLHTRHATRGEVIKENSHPFTVGGVADTGDIIGAHNGIIYNHTELNATHNRKCVVDSEHIFEHLVENLPLTDLVGYGAIEYVQNGEYYIGQCNGGELQVAKTEQGIVWASTQDAIEVACFQSGIKIETFFRIEDEHIYRVETEMIYETDKTFNLTDAPPINKKSWSDFGVLSNTFDVSGISDRPAGHYNDFNNGLTNGFITGHAWEKELTENSGGSEGLEYSSSRYGSESDICDWCGETGPCAVMTDSTLVCNPCQKELNDETPELNSAERGYNGKLN